MSGNAMVLLLAPGAVALATWLALCPWTLVATRLGHTQTFRLPRELIGVLAVCSCVLLARTLGAPKALLSLAAVIAAVIFWFRWKKARAKKLRVAHQEHCVEIVDILAADLRSGSLPNHAIERLAAEFDEISEIHAAVMTGNDIPEAWKRLAKTPGGEALNWVAAAWAVASESGAPLAGVLDAVAADVRREADLLRDIEAAVAPARSTALLMALLPLFAMGMGAGMGSSPSETITETLGGAASVSLGILLALVGVVWVDRIADGVEQQ